MSLTERSALRNTIRRRLELLEAVRANLDFPDPSDDEDESLWGSAASYLTDTESESEVEPPATECRLETPRSDDSGESVDETQAQATACSDSQNKSFLHDNEETSDDCNTGENIPGLDNTQLTDPSPLSSSSASDNETRPTTPTSSEPTSPKSAVRPTVAEIAKFRAYRRALRTILKGIDAHITATYKKHKKQMKARYAAAVVPSRPAARRRPRKYRRRTGPGDWVGTLVEWVPRPEPAPVLGPRRVKKVAKSKLAQVATPDDWLWEEAETEVKETFGLGYSYRRDRLGRRVHRI